MTWFRVDDTLTMHPKARLAGLPAMGLWVVAGAYSSQYLTDGFVPEWYVITWPNGRKLATQLVEAELWIEDERDGQTGWSFHQWHERQPTRAEVEQKRHDARERMRKFRAQDGTFARSSPDVRANERGTNAARSREVTTAPSRPIPVTTPSARPGPRGGQVDEQPDRADKLIAEWLDHAPTRPPSRVIGQVGKLLRELLDEGQDPRHVRAGLAAWASRGLHPASLPSCVHEAQTPVHANGRASTMPTVKAPHERTVAEALAIPGEDR